MRSFIVFVLLGMCYHSFAQKRNVGKVEKLPYCGVHWKDTTHIRRELQQQFNFLKLQPNDTIVDIGSSSGVYNGAIASLSEHKLHFVLVDIDTACLNSGKVAGMTNHFNSLKGSAINSSFQIINNTPDSLWLPANSYKKAWLINVLHEIPDPGKMVRDANSILQQGGELIVFEMIPKRSGQLHGGCRMPLQSVANWKEMMNKNGFQFTEEIEIIKNRGKTRIAMMRFIKA
jgi:hypothetical protein